MYTPCHAPVIDGFHVDEQLLDKCIPLFRGREISYLLHRNAEVIWLVLVPHTRAEEFYQLPPEQLQSLCAAINRISREIEHLFPYDRLNVTTIGNEVEQMHVHIVRSAKGDRFLPEEMWEKPVKVQHSPGTVRRLAMIMRQLDRDAGLHGHRRI